MTVDRTRLSSSPAPNSTTTQAPTVAPKTTPPVLGHVSAANQPRVAADVQRQLDSFLPRPRSADVARLVAAVGDDHFYDRVAALDPAHADDWHEMAAVQQAFARAEPKFEPKTRAYSESMRLTLHAALILHVVDKGITSVAGKPDLYERFLELHVTAFHENGGWFDNLLIGWLGALDVLQATPLPMWKRAHELLEGTFFKDKETVQAASFVHAARSRHVD